MPELMDRLSPEHFSWAPNRAIWLGLVDLWTDHQPVDELTLRAFFEATDQLEDVGGPAYISSLADALPALGREAGYCSILDDRLARRQLYSLGRKMQLQAGQWEGHGRDLFSEARGHLDGLDVKANGRRSPSLSSVLAEIEPLLHVRGGHAQGVLTGLTQLDRELGGFRPGQLVVLGARTSMGKTAMACCIMRHAAMAGRQVAYRSLEMTKEELTLRLLSLESGVPYKWIAGGTMAADDRVRVLDAKERMESWPAQPIIEDHGANTPEGVVAWARREAMDKHLDLVICDHLHLMVGGKGGDDGRRLEVANAARTLKLDLAKELKVPVLALAQLRRLAYGQDPRPNMEMLKESGDIEEDSDLVLLLYRPDYYKPEEHPGKAEILVAKHRNGWTGSCWCQYDREVMRFRDS
jgi:replicative DNA helicase